MCRDTAPPPPKVPSPWVVLLVRRLVLLAGAAFAFSRAAAYSGHLGAVSPPVLLATWGGRLLPILVVLHVAAGASCLWNFRGARLIGPLSWIVGLVMGWATIYAIAWIGAGEGDPNYWAAAIMIASFGTVTGGLLLLLAWTGTLTHRDGVDP